MPSKAANGEGSVFFAKGLGWCAKITQDGRRVTRKAKVQTKEGAEKLLRRLQREADKGPIGRRSPLLKRYVPEWLAAAELRGCRPRTLELYEHRINKHVLPLLGNTRLDKLTVRLVRELYTAKLKGSGQSRPLSPATVAHMHQLLGNLLKHAMREGHVGRNVLQAIDPPKVPKFEARPLQLEDARRLLDAARAHRYGTLWTFLLGTGCRFGEAAGLTWDAVDLEAGTIGIHQAAIRVRKDGRYRMVLAPPKTPAGRRTLPIPPWVAAVLKTQRDRVEFMQRKAEPVWQEMGLVFPSGVGTPLRESHVREAWIQFLKAAGLPEKTRMHDLRHTFATLMLDDGGDLVALQRNLGHSRLNVTADLYVGRVPAAQRRAVERYGELLAGAN